MNKFGRQFHLCIIFLKSNKIRLKIFSRANVIHL
jgi:hypothetical protein